MKVTIKEDDIYTPGTVQLSLSKAEWMAIKGLAAAEVATAAAPGGGIARLSNNSVFYWDLGLDWTRLFNEDK